MLAVARFSGYYSLKLKTSDEEKTSTIGACIACGTRATNGSPVRGDKT